MGWGRGRHLNILRCKLQSAAGTLFASGGVCCACKASQLVGPEPIKFGVAYRRCGMGLSNAG